MAITSAGIGSGLDVNSLVSQLVTAERAPTETRITTATNKINVTLSALGTFKGTLASLQTAAAALTGSTAAIGQHKTSVSADGYFTATATSAASPGSYEIEVLDLARAHKVASAVFADGASSVVGNGTVTLTVGSESFDVTLSDGANTLADLRDQINAASDNTGVSATILNEDGGARLILTSKSTGTDNAIGISTAAEGGGSLFSVSDVQPATDAQVKIDGFTYTSASNAISDAIEGVTLSLTKDEVGTKTTLTVSSDNSAASSAVQELVRAYNATVGVLKKFASYDATSNTGGPLMGDAAVRSAMQQLRSAMGSQYGDGDYTMLAQLGVKTNADGTLTVDSAKLDAALAADPDGVRALFSGDDGLATRMSDVLDGYLGTEGRLSAETDRLNHRLDTYKDQTEALDRRMEMVRQRYLKQFTALDTLLGQMQATSTYLTQQLANLPGSSSSS